jgi:RND family efflux transporter MFP subunit
LDVNRLRPLAEERAVSGQELDDAVQSDLAAQAQVAGSQAAIAAARSAIDAAKARLQTAELNLSFAAVVSPVSGIAGINKAQVGDLVGPSTDVLTTVSVVDPILVNFTISEQDYLQVSKWVDAKGASGDAALKALAFTLQLTDGSVYPHKGNLHAVNREVNAATGAIQIQTEFPNPGNTLRPGGFGRVSTAGGIERGALLVPQRSIVDVQGEHFVAVAGPDAVVHLRPVSMGVTQGPMQVISNGLQAGETVVVEGVQKVRDGLKVAPSPYQAQR